MGWVSYLHRAATTNYLCCGQALEDSLGAGRIGLTHTLFITVDKGSKKNWPDKHSWTIFIAKHFDKSHRMRKNKPRDRFYILFLYFCAKCKNKRHSPWNIKASFAYLACLLLFQEKKQKKQPIGLSPLPQGKGGKSGQRRALHFLTERCPWGRSNAEENNRPFGVRVRRWGKSPPAVQRCTGRVSWRLQVHVNRCLKVARLSRRVERFSIVVTPCIDEWQTPRMGVQNPAYRLAVTHEAD